MHATHPHRQIEYATAPLRLCARPPDGDGRNRQTAIDYPSDEANTRFFHSHPRSADLLFP